MTTSNYYTLVAVLGKALHMHYLSKSQHPGKWILSPPPFDKEGKGRPKKVSLTCSVLNSKW